MFRRVLGCVALVAGFIGLAAGSARADDLGLMKLVQRPEDQALVVSVNVAGTEVGDDLIVYQVGKRLLVPLGGVMHALEVAITTEPASGKASGFFIDEHRRFALDLAQGKASFDGKSFTIAPGSAERQLTDIYVDADLVNQWLGIRLRFRQEDLTLLVSSLELLPIEEQLGRNQRRAGILHNGMVDKDYAIREAPTELIGWPLIDTDIELSSNRVDGHQSQQGQFTSIVTDQLAGLDLDMALNGAMPSQAQNTSLRATLGRRDPRSDLLGPLHASEFLLGDIDSPNVPLVSNSVAGRGATLSTFDLHRVSDLQRVTLRGELPVGWQVELYRGSDLIDFQTSSTDGLYEFDNVPTIAGLNAFRLVFYGPQGQRREENRPIYVTAASVGAGETGFRLTVNQQNVDLIDAEQQPQASLFDRFDLLERNQLLEQPAVDTGGLRMVAETEHGLTDTMSLNSAVSSIPLAGTTYRYAQSGLRASVLGLLADAETAASDHGGVAASANLKGQIRGWSWLLSQNQFEGNFVSERSYDAILQLPLRSISSAQLNGILPNFGPGRLPLATSATYNEAPGGISRTELDERTSSYLGRFVVGQETQAELITAQPPQTTETVRIGTSFGPVSLRGEAINNAMPHPSFEAANVTADYRVRPDLNLRLGGVRFNNPSEDQLILGADKLYDTFAIGGEANLTNHGDFSVIFKLSFSLGVDPLNDHPVFRGESFARSGVVSPRAFIDRNGDGVFGPGDVPLENVRFQANNQPVRNAVTDNSGTTLITGLDADEETPLQIDVQSLSDPFWKPGDQKIAVLPRPGSVVPVDFPVYETGEIDGTVLLRRNGRMMQLPGMRIELIDAKDKVVAHALSGYDGAFFLEGVRLGHYRLRVAPDQLAQLHFAAVAPRDVELTRDNPSLSFGTITVESADATAGDGAPDAAPQAAPAYPVEREELPAGEGDRPQAQRSGNAGMKTARGVPGLRTPHAQLVDTMLAL